MLKSSSPRCRSELSQSSTLTLSSLISQKVFWWWLIGMWKGVDAYEWRGRHAHQNAHLLWLIGKEILELQSRNWRASLSAREHCHILFPYSGPHISCCSWLGNGAKPWWWYAWVEIQSSMFCCILQILLNGLE